VSLLLHASMWYQGLDFWSPAPYIHHALLGENRIAQAIDVSQMCSGAMSAIELAAAHLTADPARRAAIVTTADRFQPPGFNRWQTEGASIVYGDGAGAVVLARGAGFARLLAVQTVVDTTLEPMNRGDSELTLFSPAARGPVDNQARRAAFLRQIGTDEVIARTNRALADAVHGLLDEAGLELADVSRFVFPNVGFGLLNAAYLKPLGLDASQTAWELGRTTGHVGTADQLTGLTYLLEQGQLRAGERVMLLGIGYGFFWSCAIVECLEVPDWSAPAS
jgi:3-oxoacyl-[acyl-carrier-protein] synthase-3